jgi:hypothetical protein
LDTCFWTPVSGSVLVNIDDRDGTKTVNLQEFIEVSGLEALYR